MVTRGSRHAAIATNCQRMNAGGLCCANHIATAGELERWVAGKAKGLGRLMKACLSVDLFVEIICYLSVHAASLISLLHYASEG